MVLSAEVSLSPNLQIWFTWVIDELIRLCSQNIKHQGHCVCSVTIDFSAGCRVSISHNVIPVVKITFWLNCHLSV